jgi:hypothetical protein
MFSRIKKFAKKVTATAVAGTGSFILQTGVGVFTVDAFAQYCGLGDVTSRVALSAVSLVVVGYTVVWTRQVVLWEKMSKIFQRQEPEQAYAQEDIEDVQPLVENRRLNNIVIGAKVTVVGNIIPITLFSGYLGSKALLIAFITDKNSAIYPVACYTIISELGTFFAFFFREVSKNTAELKELWEERNINRSTVIKAGTLCGVSTFSNVLLVNFLINSSLDEIPFTRNMLIHLKYGVSGTVAIMTIPISLLTAMFQAYKYFSGNDFVTVNPLLLTPAQRRLLAVHNGMGYLFLGYSLISGFMATIYMCKQLGADPHSILVQVFSLLPAGSMAFSDYVFLIRHSLQHFNKHVLRPYAGENQQAFFERRHIPSEIQMPLPVPPTGLVVAITPQLTNSHRNYDSVGEIPRSITISALRVTK